MREDSGLDSEAASSLLALEPADWLGAFAGVLQSWEVAGAVDADSTLTELGVWVLPRALAWAWNDDFDETTRSDRHAWASTCACKTANVPACRAPACGST